ncbi:unnamed protein product [Lymnaea stagnalis]|uniref:Uncharacterized protein n=1 Tax=Lymnaea stagnalis TaxID=6523 RepID=A0AAV2ID90_LYMST
MAKSIRSKHRRKMRNVKRQHYAKKDLEKLKQVVARASELSEIVTMKSVEEIKVQQQSKEEGSSMEVDKTQKHFDKKTKQDENGHYPEWMNQRAIKRHKEKLTKKKKKVGNKLKW